MTDAERPHGTSWRVLRRRNFAIFWSAALVSNTGTWMQLLTVPFVIYQMTKSTTWLGVAAAAAFVPNTVSSLIGGTFADRHSRRRILMVTQSILMALAFALWFVWVQGWATPGLVVGLVFVSGIAAGVNIAAWQAFVTQLVEPEELVDAVRVNSLQFTGARAFGPALAGLVLEFAGPSTAFLLNALSYLCVVVALQVIRPRAQVYAEGAQSIVQQLRDGLRVARRDTTLFLAIVSIGVVSFLGTSVIQLSPAIAKQLFHVGSGKYGLLVAAFGVGALCGSTCMIVVADRMLRSTVLRYALAGMALALVALSLAPHYTLGIAAMFMMGATYLMVNTPLNTALQARVADSYRGRVLSVYLSALLLGLPLGALVGGKLASMIPLRVVLFAYGAAMLVYRVAASLRYDRFRPLDHGRVDDLSVETAT